jgi:hypothetical protein
LRTRRHVVARACLERLGRGPAAETLEALVKVMAVDTTGLAPAAARSLGTRGDAAAEGALIAALDRDVPGLRAAAAGSLGRLGSVAAVLPLKEAVEAYGQEGEFASAARQAVARIQQRAGGAGHGQLTLSEDASGRISLAEGTAGQLSVPDGEPGRLSVARPTPQS